MFYVEQFWKCEKLEKSNKLKAGRVEKNIKKLLDSFKKRVLQKGGFFELGKTNFFSQMES